MTTTTAPGRRPRRRGRRLLRVLRGTAYLIVGLLLTSQLALGAIGAYVEHTDHKVLEIIGGSMEPLYSVGDALVLDVDTSNLKPGDVITFHSGPQELTTHRILAEKTIEGRLYYQTQGDANQTPDPDYAPADAVVGSPVLHIPHGGIVTSWMQSRTGRIATFGPALLLVLLLEVVHIARTWRDDPTGTGADVPDAADAADAAGDADAGAEATVPDSPGTGAADQPREDASTAR